MPPKVNPNDPAFPGTEGGIELLVDQFIETDIRAWIEGKQREAEQLELEDFKAWDA